MLCGNGSTGTSYPQAFRYGLFLGHLDLDLLACLHRHGRSRGQEISAAAADAQRLSVGADLGRNPDG